MSAQIIPQNIEAEQVSSKISNFIREFNISQLLRLSNFKKIKGVPCQQVLKFIFSLVFSQKNLFRYLQTEENSPHKKDVVYRFLNSASFNWRKLLLLLSSTVIMQKLVKLTSADNHRHVFIIDDSIYSRARSKRVELLAKTYDHVKKKYVHGFRMLTLGWSDGISFIPLAFSMLSSPDKRNRLCGTKQMDMRTNGGKRRKESIQKATSVMLKLLEEAKKYLIPGSVVLFDSWFAFPAIISAVLDMSLHTICMVKAMPKVRYLFEGKELPLNQLYRAIRKKPGRAKILASVIVHITYKNKKIPVKIVFVRNRNKSAKRRWLALLSTDTELSDEEIVRIYGKRWDIEVFFKATKSFLGLGKEYQSRCYDALVAHTTIVFMRYTMLEIESRDEEDPRTIGNLFYICCAEMEDIKLIDSLKLILSILKECIEEIFIVSKEELDALFDLFLKRLPIHYKRLFGFFTCES